MKAGVLERGLFDKVNSRLSAIKPMKAVFDRNYVKKLGGLNVKKGKNKLDLAEQLRQDIRDFRKSSGVSRLIIIWCVSTECFLKPTPVHQTLKILEKGMTENDKSIAPSMVYAYASLMQGVPFANGAPNLTVDIPAMHELAQKLELPICGNGFKARQTLMKSVLAPAFKAACLASVDGTRRIFWATATGKCSTIPARSKRRKSRSWDCWSIFFSQTFIRNSTGRSSTRFA